MYKLELETMMVFNINNNHKCNWQFKEDIVVLAKNLKYEYYADMVFQFGLIKNKSWHATLYYATCEGDRGLVGFNVFETSLTDDGNNTIYNHFVLLDPSVRGQGLNLMYLDHMLGIEECRGIDRVHVDARGNDSIKYWSNLGFNFDKKYNLNRSSHTGKNKLIRLTYKHIEGHKFYKSI